MPTDPKWSALADVALRAVCERLAEFTVDDVTAAVEASLTPDVRRPSDPRAIGGVLTRGAERAWCVRTARTVPSRRRECHNRPVRVWRSKLAAR